MCDKQTLKKYTSRNSPPYPAQACHKEFGAATRARGNDGNIYATNADSRGIYRWVLEQKSPKAAGAKSPKAAGTKSPKKDDEYARVLAAVTGNGYLLKDAPKFKNNYNIVLAAVTSKCYRGGCSGALEFASKELCNNKSIIMAAVEGDGEALFYASKKLQADPEIVMTAVQHIIEGGNPLHYASTELKDDFNIVKMAVKHNGFALQSASARLRDDIDIVKTAIKNFRPALKFASRRLGGE